MKLLKGYGQRGENRVKERVGWKEGVATRGSVTLTFRREKGKWTWEEKVPGKWQETRQVCGFLSFPKLL